ncbi:alpha/beta hydrolase family protein [Thermodesulfobacteriota bacterium]
MLRFVSLFLISSFFYMGCSPLTCMPPSYYAPDPEVSYTAQEVRVLTKEGYRLAGTLTIPSDFPSPFPAVVLITGSHPQDRDMVGSRMEPSNKYRPFRQISDALSLRGVAVLRMDDRGYGCSEGGDINDATIFERAEDIKAGLRYLKDRIEIDEHRLGLLGISEGGTVGPMVAAADPSIRALIIMAGPAANGREILEWQVRHDTALIEGVTDKARGRILKQRMMDVEKYIAEAKDNRWQKAFVEYDPLPTARNVLCPALIIHGDRDANVPVRHAHLLAEAMRAGGNADVTVTILPDHNHLFLKDTDGRFTDKRYWKLLQHTNKLSEGFLKIMADWVSSRLKP